MYTCSPYHQFLITGSALWLPGRPLQPKIHHDLWPEYVDCDLSQQLFCHKVGKEDIMTEGATSIVLSASIVLVNKQG